MSVYITSGSAVMKEVNIFDVRGRLIYSAKGINASKHSISNLIIEHQVLIVNISTDKGKVSKKIIY